MLRIGYIYSIFYIFFSDVRENIYKFFLLFSVVVIFMTFSVDIVYEREHCKWGGGCIYRSKGSFML